MNTVIEAIKNRRSVRAYEARAISRDTLEAIIEAGRWAPSGMNLQLWRFVVVQDAEFRQKLFDAAVPRYYEWRDRRGGVSKAVRKPIDDITEDPVFYSAPVIVFVVGTKLATYAQDCPMVCHNIMLAAHSFGIGSCWVGYGQLALQDEGVREALELKDDEEVFGPILLGYPKGGFPEPPRKKVPTIKWI